MANRPYSWILAKEKSPKDSPENFICVSKRTKRCKSYEFLNSSKILLDINKQNDTINMLRHDELSLPRFIVICGGNFFYAEFLTQTKTPETVLWNLGQRL
jgi:hypothetical protein